MSGRLSKLHAKAVEEARDTASNFLETLCKIWEELGLDDESIQNRFSTFKSHTTDLYTEMIREEQGLVEKQRRKIEHLMQQLDTINIDLNMSESVNIDGLGVLPAKSKLEECLSSLRSMHAESQKQRADLVAQEQELCEQLGEEPSVRPERNALAKETLICLKDRVHGLQKEREKRMSGFLKSRSAIVDLYALLETQPDSAFARSVVDSNTKHFSLMPKSLEDVEDLHGSLKVLLQEKKDEVEALRDRASQLWERLEVDVEEREAFHENFPGFSNVTKEALVEEIHRCEELKHQNLERFITRMREELAGLWDKCCYSPEERDNFHFYHSDDFNDDLLDAHEAEVKRLTEYYEANRAVFELLGRRAELWERMAHLEAKAQDANRFSNRGGQLLKEEKERKQLQRELPQVETKLKNMIYTWEESSGEPFLLHGRRACEVLDEQWENRKLEKEREKQERKMTHQKQLRHDAVMGTTMMSGGLKRKIVTATPEMQRKQPRFTPAVSASKIQARNANTSLRKATTRHVATRATGARLPMSRNGSSKMQQVAFNVNYNINVVAPSDSNETLCSAISYSDFTNHLEARATRSSAAPNAIHFRATAARPALSPLNGTMKTPQKTMTSKSTMRYPQSAPAKPPRQLRSTPKTPSNNPIPKLASRTAPKFTRTRTNLPIIF